MTLSPERVRATRLLAGQSLDRPPVWTGGGMMNAAVPSVLEGADGLPRFPDAHRDPKAMADAAAAIADRGGFECFPLPFCLTAEAEALGSPVDLGDSMTEAKIAREAFSSSRTAVAGTGTDVDALLESSRTAALYQAISRLRRERPELPVVAGVCGPVTLAASWVEPSAFLKDLRRDSEAAEAALARAIDLLAEHVGRIVAAGADVVAVSDPTAAGSVLGPAYFRRFAKPAIAAVVDAVHAAGKPAILHVCGDVRDIGSDLAAIPADLHSLDAPASLSAFKALRHGVRVMGNLDTFLLAEGMPERIAAATRRLVDMGVDVAAPACGLSTVTPLANIRAFTNAVKSSGP
jgi:[methyl-Co(III) methanol-specific corrinoid protein]:coenzyme M methyltransferase